MLTRAGNVDALPVNIVWDIALVVQQLSHIHNLAGNKLVYCNIFYFIANKGLTGCIGSVSGSRRFWRPRICSQVGEEGTAEWLLLMFI
jgi:hypothetical protein